MTDRYQRGDIAPAIIKNLATNTEIKCMFNPQEYKISKSNGWSSKKARGQNQPHAEYSGGGLNSLTLNLVFDTYETHEWFGNQAREDVRKYTQELWKLTLVNKSSIDANNGQGVRGDMKAVLKAILLDYEARSLDVVANQGYGKMREPVLRFSHLLRAFNFTCPCGTYPIYWMDSPESAIGQNPLRAPTVFNFFEPNTANCLKPILVQSLRLTTSSSLSACAFHTKPAK